MSLELVGNKESLPKATGVVDDVIVELVALKQNTALDKAIGTIKTLYREKQSLVAANAALSHTIEELQAGIEGSISSNESALRGAQTRIAELERECEKLIRDNCTLAEALRAREEELAVRREQRRNSVPQRRTVIIRRGR